MANTNCDSCNSCDSCYSCNFCDYCNSCDSCETCDYCYSCDSCESCNYCYSCDYSAGLRLSEHMIFCLGEGQYEKKGDGYRKLYRAWNKDVSEVRYSEILKEVKEILSDFKLDARNSWKEEWQKVQASQWSKIAKIPEFDLEITKKITRLSKIDIDEEKTIDIEGKKFTVSELKSLIASAK